jgi:hypothetical protein
MQKTQQLILKQTVINYLYLGRFSLPQKINRSDHKVGLKKRPKNHKYELFFSERKKDKSYMNNLLSKLPKPLFEMLYNFLRQPYDKKPENPRLP